MHEVLNDAFAGPAWHGPALAPSLRGITEAEAAWRPARGRHNIWEVVVHAAYWKHIVRQRLTGARDRFPLRGRNWFARPDPTAKASSRRSWRDDLELLRIEHDALAAAVKGIAPNARAKIVHARQTAEENVNGIAMHDVYHAGQIQLIKTLARRRGGR